LGLDRIELRHLEQVVEICRAGSFSEAARRLQLSQPALSKSISRLEGQLGICLFERSGGAAKATELGQLVAERGRRLLASSNDLSRELRQRAGGASGRLRIGVGPATRYSPLPEVLKGLLARFPDLSIEVRHDHGLKVMRGVDEGRYDLAFGFSENAEPYGDLIRIKVFEDRFIVVARPGHPATLADHPLSPAELLKYPMASVGVTAGFAAWLGGVGEAEAANAAALVCDDFDLMQECLPPGYTMRGTHFVFRRALAAGQLVEVPIQWRPPYHCWMLTTPEKWRLPIVKMVAELARGGPLPEEASDAA
jgi:DNA-binding transcriptional LysR family regulator